MKIYLNILFLLMALHNHAQSPESLIKSGNSYYTKAFYKAAANDYDKAIGSRYNAVALMNKGNALYKDKQFNLAINTYHQVADNKSNGTIMRSGAYYNAGVVYSAQKKIDESIEEYKAALRLNANDTKARENLQKALLERKKGGGGGGEQKQSQSSMNKNQVQQQLDKLEEKEKQTSRKLSNQKTQYSGSAGKDW